MKKIFYFTGFFTTFFFMSFLFIALSDNAVDFKKQNLFSTKEDTNLITSPLSVETLWETPDATNSNMSAKFTIDYSLVEENLDKIDDFYLQLNGTWEQEVVNYPSPLPPSYSWETYYFDFKINASDWDFNNSFSLEVIPDSTSAKKNWVVNLNDPNFVSITYKYYITNRTDLNKLEFYVDVWHEPIWYFSSSYSGIKNYNITAEFVSENKENIETEMASNLKIKDTNILSNTIIIDYDLVLGYPMGYPFIDKYIGFLYIKDVTDLWEETISLPEGFNQKLILDDSILNSVHISPNHKYEIMIYTSTDVYGFPIEEILYQQNIITNSDEAVSPTLVINNAEVSSSGFTLNYTYIPGNPVANEKAKLKIEDLETNHLYEFDLEKGLNMNLFLDKIYFNNSSFLPGSEFLLQIYTLDSLSIDIESEITYLLIEDEFFDPHLLINELVSDIDSLTLEYSYIPGSKTGSDGNSVGNEKGYIMVENLNTGEIEKKEISQTNMEEIVIDSITFPNITFVPNQLYEVKLYTENSYGKDMEVSSTISTLDLASPDIILYANFDNLDNPTSLNVTSQYYNQGDANSYSIKVDINNGELIQVVENQDTLEIDLSTTEIKSINFSYNWTNDKYFDDSTVEFNNFYEVQGNIIEFHPNTDNSITDYSKNNTIFWTTIGITAPIAGLGVVGLGRFIW